MDILEPNLRRCFREPVQEVFEAAKLLEAAVACHALGNKALASELVRASNLPAVREWTESLWGAKSPYVRVVRSVPKDSSRGAGARMPDDAMRRALLERDGHYCRFCGVPVIRKEVRSHFQKLHPELPLWGRRNVDQHAAFQALWAQYDHVVPHSRGGATDLENLVVTCAPCNFARMEYTTEEVGLEDPRARPPQHGSWTGLEEILAIPTD